MKNKSARAGALRLVVLGLLLAPAVAAGAAEKPKTANTWTLVLEKVLPGEKPLELRLVVDGGEITESLCTAPDFNRVAHDADVGGLSVGDDGLTGSLKVVVHPDNYVPADGKPIELELKVDAEVTDGKVAGSYTGRSGGRDVKGIVTGTRRPAGKVFDSYGRAKLRLIGGVARLFRKKGPSWKYALDMNLMIAFEKGKAGTIQMESVVPDYRRYSATIEKHDLKLSGHSLTGTITVNMNYGEQGTGRDEERYVYSLDLTVIGDVVGGTWSAGYGDQEFKDRRVIGEIDRAGPPKPEESIAWIRLHKAMGKDWPVMLNVSLADDGLFNGFAWASGYNHQPQTLDASKLKRNGDRLTGEVKVTICPDCYKPPEIFTMVYEIDATIDGFAIRGTYTGNDNEKDVKGRITGELRPKRETDKPVKTDQLKQVTLNLGYSLVSGAMPKKDWKKYRPNYAKVVFEMKDGKVTGAKAVNPFKEEMFDAKVTKRDLNFTGDRVHGLIEFELTSDKGVKPGTYRYTFEGILNGAKISGYWRGSRDGKPIYTKSAKMGGSVQ